MKKIIFVLVDGMSFEIMQYPEMIDLSFLKETQIRHFYPECLLYYDEWKRFKCLGMLSPSVSRGRIVSSAGISAMLSTGMTENLIDFQKADSLNSISVFSKLKKKGILTAALTNMPLTDSTVGMLLSPDKLNKYKEKTGDVGLAYNNIAMQNNVAENIDQYAWDLLCGGGRMCFYPEDTEDIVTAGEFGKRTDRENVLERLKNVAGLNLMYENDFIDADIDLSHDNRYLILLHHNDFMHENERIATRTPEPRLSEAAEKIIDALDSSQKDWFFFIESGKVDSAAHNNNGYFVIGEILEIYRFLYRLRTKENHDDYTVIFTSDHGTGGLSFADNYDLPYDAMKKGAYWSDGPGIYRHDTTIFMQDGKLRQINDFTPSFTEKENLARQQSVVYNKIAMHSRAPVPLLGNGFHISRFNYCQYHYDLYHRIMDFYEISKKKGVGDLVIVSGPPASGKSTISREITKRTGMVYLCGDYYLNCVQPNENCCDDWVLNIAVSDMLHDAYCLSKHGNNVILDFVFIREEDFMFLLKFAQEIKIRMVLLQPPLQVIMERDGKRSEEERMGERCKILAEEFVDAADKFSRFDLIIPDALESIDHITEYIMSKL